MMINEIGSEFWDSPGDDTKGNLAIPFWLNKFGQITLTSSGRGALSLCLEQIKPHSKRVLMPAYICESVIRPFEQAGYELIFYDLNNDLTPQLAAIELPEIGVFLHMGYFGFPTNRGLAKVIAKLKSKSVIIIEDVTHSLFSEQQPFQNDFVVGSIRKWLGIPSGGFLGSKQPIEAELAEAPVAFIEKRKLGLALKSNYMQMADPSLKETFLQAFQEAEEFLDRDLSAYKIDKQSNVEINQLTVDDLCARRVENFNYLQEQIKPIEGIEAVFKTLPERHCPLFFPVYVVDDRTRLRADLIAQAIYCPVHWPMPAAVAGKLTGPMTKRYHWVLSIPCDQRYGIDDMKRIIKAITGSMESRRVIKE